MDTGWVPFSLEAPEDSRLSIAQNLQKQWILNPEIGKGIQGRVKNVGHVILCLSDPAGNAECLEVG